MAIIIGALFLPYTVRFEVDAQQEEVEKLVKANAVKVNSLTEKEAAHYLKGPYSYAPASSGKTNSSPPVSSTLNDPTPNSILRSLASQDPSSLSDKKPSTDKGESNVKDFFYNNQTFRRPAHEQPPERNTDKVGSQYIQPRSRFYKNPSTFNKSLVDLKKDSDETGLPSVRMNRSSTNLNSPSLSQTNLSVLSQLAHNAPKKPSSLSKPVNTFILHDNDSTNSLDTTTEENDSFSESKYGNPWNDNIYFSEIENAGREAKLTPYGGFSNPSIENSLYNESNLFDKSKWEVVFTSKGNVSVRKAVRLAVESGIIQERKWVGTIAMPSDEVSENVIQNISARLSEDYNCEAIFPNDITFDGHYNSFCKQILWPTLHYQIPDDPKSKAFEDHSWGYYKKLNQLVADKIIEVYKKENGDCDPNDPNNMIWIHDYHLLLVPSMIREKLPHAKIGLFLHVSFPSSEVFRCIAQRQEILKGMLGANCISFQTEEYVRHFLQTCNRLLLADTNNTGITYEGNLTLVNTIPVGIDCDSLNEVIQSDEVVEWRRLIRERWGDMNLIVSRDKLDKLRGIKQKLLAYEMLLKNNPSFVDNTVLIQIGSSSNDAEYESEILRIVDRINALSDSMGIQSVVLLQQDIEFEQYLALQCEADVFVVSSMREGLNLTCHEFITATSEKKSPLMISEFTGSSHLLEANGRGSLLINPWAIREFSEVLYKSLTMDPKEKLERWSNCYKIVYQQDSRNWIKSCLQSINAGWELNKRRNRNTLTPFTEKDYNKFLEKSSSGRRLYFLNFDTPSDSPTPSDKKLSAVQAEKYYVEPAMKASLLSDFWDNEKNQVYLMSFMKRSELDRLYGRIPALGLIAENGGYIKLIGSTKWISIVDQKELGWMPQVKQVIESKVERLTGAYCEVEDCTIRFHGGQSLPEDKERSHDAMGDIIQHINVLFEENEGVHATLIRDVVVVQNNNLALKALEFVTKFYREQQTDSLLKEYPVRTVTSPLSSSKMEKDVEFPTTSTKRISGVFVGGGATVVDESIYEFAGSLLSEGTLDTALTVAILDESPHFRTAATHYVNGKNELLRLLTKS